MDRVGFKTKLGVLTATIASAVGLGNIWKVPALIGEHGGGAFLFIYLIASIVLGLPLLITEIALGRNKQGSVVTAFTKGTPRSSHWYLVSWMAVSSTILLIAFYSDVAGWVFTYFAKSITGTLQLTNSSALATEEFVQIISTPTTALLGQLSVFIVAGVVLYFGIQKGIEQITKFLLPMLTILLTILAIKGLTLEGAEEGLRFLFMPDFSKVTSETILIAVGLAFFKLSLGSGTMITYGSYFPKSQNIPRTALRVMLADLAISIIAGIAIFPAVFTYGFEVTSGASLLFVTIPTVFSSIPYGSVFISLFFLLSIFAALGATISILEVSIAVFVDFKLSRTKALISTLSICTALGVLATLSLTPVLSSITVSGKSLFDLFDFVSSNILMISTGFCTALYVGWFSNTTLIKDEISNNGTIGNARLLQGWLLLVRYSIPILLIATLLNALIF